MVDLFSDDTRRNPYPLYDQLRSTSPVFQLPNSDTWMIFDYEGVNRALTDHETFSSMVVPPTGKAPDWLVFNDPPRHRNLRSIINRAFTPKSISNLEPRMKEISRELLSTISRNETIDIATAYSTPFPAIVIAE